MRCGLAVLLLVACGGDPGAPDASSPIDAAGPADAAPALFAMPATNATIAVADVTVSGSSMPDGVTVALDHGVGTLRLGVVAIDVMAYVDIPLGSYDLVHMLGVGADAVYYAWLYCFGGSLSFIHVEGTKTLYKAYDALGTCAIQPGLVDGAVSLPATAVSRVDVRASHLVDGTGVSIAHDGHGSVVLGGVAYEAYVVNDLDCSSCGGAGWRELHLFLREDTTTAGLSILYLFPDGRPVEANYTILLPSLAQVGQTVFDDATWAP